MSGNSEITKIINNTMTKKRNKRKDNDKHDSSQTYTIGTNTIGTNTSSRYAYSIDE